MKQKTTAQNTKENRIFLGLGSNVGDKEKNLRTAIKELQKNVEVVKISSLYESEPLGYANQPDFLNQVVEISTKHSPIELLKILLKIESKLGRVRSIKNGPRIIDLDILLYGNRIVERENLQIPHPRIIERKFVLLPLKEIAGEIKHPQNHKHIEKLIEECSDNSLVKQWIRKK